MNFGEHTLKPNAELLNTCK